MALTTRVRRMLPVLGNGLLFALPIRLYALVVVHPPPGFGFDLHVFWEAARAVLHGSSPYDPAGVARQRLFEQTHMDVQPIAPWAVYPPALFVALAPLGLLPWHAAAVLGVGAMAVAPFLALRVMGVRDWRCYFAMYASMPLLSSIALGAISTALMLGLALLWRGRHTVAVGAATIIAKLFLWPLLIVIAAISGMRRAVLLGVVALAVTIASWAVIGFADITTYPKILSDLSAIEAHHSFSTTGFAYAIGLPENVGTAAGIVLGAWVGAVAFRAGRRGDRDVAFTLALVASLFLSPIVWPHYLALLFIPLAARSPRFSALWLVPVLLWIHPLQETDGSPWAFILVWGCVAVVTISVVRPSWLGPRASRAARSPRARDTASPRRARSRPRPPRGAASAAPRPRRRSYAPRPDRSYISDPGVVSFSPVSRYVLRPERIIGQPPYSSPFAPSRSSSCVTVRRQESATCSISYVTRDVPSALTSSLQSAR